jgi:hypothetical protein
MRRQMMLAALALCALTQPAKAQGVIPIALQQVINANGQPIAGALLYIYQAGTVATPQNAFADPGLTIRLSNPLVADATGRRIERRIGRPDHRRLGVGREPIQPTR